MTIYICIYKRRHTAITTQPNDSLKSTGQFNRFIMHIPPTYDMLSLFFKLAVNSKLSKRDLLLAQVWVKVLQLVSREAHDKVDRNRRVAGLARQTSFMAGKSV